MGLGLRACLPRSTHPARPWFRFSTTTITPTAMTWLARGRLRYSPGLFSLAALGCGDRPARPGTEPPWRGRPRPGQARALPRRIPRFVPGSARRDHVTRRFVPSSRRSEGTGERSIAGRVIPGSARVVSFVARSLDRLRGLDRFLKLADRLLRSSPDVLCVVVGDPIVRRGLDVAFHNRDYVGHLLAQNPLFDRERVWFLGLGAPSVVAEVLAASDLHVAPSRPYPVARSLLEADGLWCRGAGVGHGAPSRGG